MKITEILQESQQGVAEGWKTGATLGGIAGGMAGGIPGAMVGAGIGAGLQLGWTKKDQELKQQKYELAKLQAKKGIPTEHFIQTVKQLQRQNLTPAEIGYTIWGPDPAVGGPLGLSKNFSTVDYWIVSDIDWDSWDDLGREIISKVNQGTTRRVRPYDKWGKEMKEQAVAEGGQG